METRIGELMVELELDRSKSRWDLVNEAGRRVREFLNKDWEGWKRRDVRLQLTEFYWLNSITLVARYRVWEEPPAE